MAAADSATELDLDIDAVESARIAIDELAALLLATGSWKRLVVTLRTEDARLEVFGRVSDLDGEATEVHVDRVVEELLGMCVDEFELLEGPSFRFSIASSAPGRSPG